MKLGLRAKSALALGVSILAVLALATVAGSRAISAIGDNLGIAFTRNFTQYNKQRILSPVLRELALSQRFADSEITRRWLLDEENPAKKSLFFAEARGYRQAFADKSYFVISARTHHYYFNDRKSAWSDKPRYTLKANDSDDAWFFTSMKNTRDFNVNVNVDTKLKVTKVWFNVVIKDGSEKLGLAGTGLSINTALDTFLETANKGVTPIIIDEAGVIQAHPVRTLVNYDTVGGAAGAQSTLYKLLPKQGDDFQLRQAMARARQDDNEIQMMRVQLGGRPQLLALTYAPELKWFIITAVDLKLAQVTDMRLWIPVLLGAIVLLGVLLLIIVIGVDRFLLTPILRLTASARAMAGGNFDVELPIAGSDELGQLTRSFGDMADRVRDYTQDLEAKIKERTGELESANSKLRKTSQNLDDSIRYARLIQSTILPDNQMQQVLGAEYFAWWKPRDVVGGDFYVFREAADGFLIGVVDCAGHGIPGALMTMAAYAALEVAMDKCELNDPAAILNDLDARLSAMRPDERIHGEQKNIEVATHLDAGLAFVDCKAKVVIFAGAKVSLHWCDAADPTGNADQTGKLEPVVVNEIAGQKMTVGGRSLGRSRARKKPSFESHKVDLTRDRKYYFSTDGLLDQAGGAKGFGFGKKRFLAFIAAHVDMPFDVQKSRLEEVTASYQGQLPQRDDIVVIGFSGGNNFENT